MTYKSSRLNLVYFSIITVCLVANMQACPSPCYCTGGELISSVNCDFKNLTNDDLKTMVFPMAFRKLLLSGNRLTHFPIEIDFIATSFTTLFLTNNKISTIPFSNTLLQSQVTFIYLGNNLIKGLSGNNFSTFRNVRHLLLNGNLITHANAGAFANMKRLQSLNLNDNLITDLHPQAFTTNLKLEALHLQNNHLSNIHPDTFSSNYNLKVLYLNDNELTTLAASAVEPVVGLELTDNLLRCDCQMRNLSLEFRGKFDPSNPFLRLTGTCREPKSLRGTFLVDLPETLACTSCNKHRCLNEAKCNPLNDLEYKCVCRQGYYGRYCEMFNLCLILQSVCKNNGTCRQVLATKVECQCKEGFFGEQCEVTCSERCHLNAVCSSEDKCTCKPGFSGNGLTTCQSDNIKTSVTNKEVYASLVGLAVGVVLASVFIGTVFYVRKRRTTQLTFAS